MTKYITLAVWGNKKSHTKKHFTLKPAKRARSRNYRPRERHEQHEEFSIWNRWLSPHVRLRNLGDGRAR